MDSAELAQLAALLRAELEKEPSDPRRTGRGEGFNAELLRRVYHIKLKMYQEKGHALPHLHVDCGSDNHAASFAIDPPRCLEGKLSSRDNSVVLSWIAAHKDRLLQVWHALQIGAPHASALAELRGGVLTGRI